MILCFASVARLKSNLLGRIWKWCKTGLSTDWHDFYLYSYGEGLRMEKEQLKDLILHLATNIPDYEPNRRRAVLQIQGFSAALKYQLVCDGMRSKLKTLDETKKT